MTDVLVCSLLPIGNHDLAAQAADLRGRRVDVDELLRWPGVPAMFAFRDEDGNGLKR